MAVSSMTFDESYYLTQNPDVLTAILNGFFTNAEQHFNLHGYKELRDPNSAFDTSYYLSANPDVLSAGVNPFNHFIANGASENRAPTEALATAGTTFDSATYLSTYPDVQTAITAGSFTSAYQHWVLFGQFETRTAQTTDGTALTGSGSSSSTGSTFTLTTALDNLTGTSWNDTFVGDNGSTSLGDQVNGGSGTDTLKLFGTATVPQTTSIEVIQFDGINANASTENRSGVTSVILANSTFTGNNTMTLANGETLTVQNHEGAFDIDLTISSTSTTSQTITLNDVGQTAVPDIDVTATSLTELTLTGTGSKSAVNLLDTENILKTLTVTGDQALTITNAAITSLTTVNLSAATVGQTFNTGATNDVTITGGAGNDTVNFTAALTTKDTLDGGAGTDTLGVTVGAGITGDLNVKNFEILRLNDVAATAAIDMDNVTGITTVRRVEGTASHVTTVTDLATTATTIEFVGTGAAGDQSFDGLVIDYDTTSDISAATITFANAGVEADNVDIQTGITINEVDVVTITAADVGTTAGERINLGTVSITGSKSLTVTSNSDVTVAITGGTTLATINFSGADAGVTVSDVSDFENNAKVFLGDGNDSFTTNNTIDQITIDAGAGNDTIDLGTNTTGNTITTGTGADTVKFAGDASDAGHTITDFSAGSGGDIIDLDINGAAAAGAGAALTAVQSLATGAIAATTGLLIYTGNNLASADEAGVEALFDTTTSNLEFNAASDEVYLVASNGTNAYLFFLDAAATDTEFTAADDVGTLIATLSGVTDATTLTAANFADFL